MHKKECKNRAAELKDIALFKKPQRGECDICMLPLPLCAREQQYQSCCGKVLCLGCIYGIRATKGENHRTICPFCRTPAATSAREQFERIKKRAEAEDVNAIFHLGCMYADGKYDLQQDYEKANELWLRAGELGNAMAYQNIADAYLIGEGVEKDMKKAKYYYELAAMGGDAVARYSLGIVEANEQRNANRAVKHFMFRRRLDVTIL